MQAVASGKVVRGDYMASLSAEDRAQETRARKELLARASASQEEWAALGADMAMQIYETRARDGFLRRLCMPQVVGNGEIPRVITRVWDTQSIVATGPSDLSWQVIRPRNYQPAEFEIKSNLRADNIDIQQGGSDILDDLYNQGMDSQMVQEDRIWKRAADMSVGVVNPIEYISGQLSPQILARITNSIRGWNLPAVYALMAYDYWEDISGNPDFMNFFDPVMKYDLAYSGVLGQINGMQILTDGFRQPNQKVLEKGEIYIVSAAEHHACFSDRGGINSTPTDGTQTGSTTKGWFMYETFSFTLANPRSVQKAKRA
jgi:hypothetical protein